MTSNMVNIKKLIIDNFQSHEHTELDFASGFNIIFGPSDFGKSAIIRAIKWVLYNEPRGTDFIRHGTSTAKVTMELNNGHIIIRERSQSKNRYILIYPDGKSMTFEGFGNEIPGEIIKAHGIPKVELDNDSNASLNIGGQLEGPFLLSETGAVRAKAIGRLIGLHIIDRAIRNCNLDLRRESQLLEKTKSELQEVDLRLEEYKHLKVIGEKLKESEDVIKIIEALITRKNRCEALKEETESVENEYRILRKKYDRLNKLKECEIDIKNCEIYQKNLDMLSKIKNVSREINAETGDLSRIMEKTACLDECFNILKNAVKRKDLLEKAGMLKTSMDKVDREVQSVQIQLEKTGNVAEFDNLLKISLEKAGRIEKMASVLQRLNEITYESKENEKVLGFNEKIDRCNVVLDGVNEKIDRLNKIQDLKGQLDTAVNNLVEAKKFIELRQKEIKEYSSKYIEVFGKAGKCPLCGSGISEDVLEEIIKHYGEV